MSVRMRKNMDEQAFFDWLQHQERRHELVDGVPMMMAGADAGHDTVVINIIASLRQQLRGGPCRPYSADTAIRIPQGNIRYPDVSVDCGTRHPRSHAAALPTLVVEVLSPSTRVFDQDDKLDEYKLVASIMHVLFVSPLAPDIRLHTRTQSGAWTVTPFSGLDAAVELAPVGARLTMAEIYEDVTFDPQPRLVLLDADRSDIEPE